MNEGGISAWQWLWEADRHPLTACPQLMPQLPAAAGIHRLQLVPCYILGKQLQHIDDTISVEAREKN